jgi:hypothetical protein
VRLLATTISPVFVVPRSLALLVFGAGRFLLSTNSRDRALGTCVACRQPVYASDAFLRYRGEYYHGGLCVEVDPPAARWRAELAGRVR